MMLNIEIGTAPSEPPMRRVEQRGSWAEKALEDGHDEEHGDEDGGGHEAKRNSVDGAVEVAPSLPLRTPLDLQRRHNWPPVRHSSDL